MTENIYVMSLEPIESRYTGQWMTALPKALEKVGVNVINLTGDSAEYKKSSGQVTEGAFLNFTDTNLWKNEQINKFVMLMKAGKVKNGDIVFFADAWHSGIIQVKYMSELLDLDLKIAAIWHAGSYDEHDFLGRKIEDTTWSYAFERSLYLTIDFNFFATQFHIDLFRDVLLNDGYAPDDKSKMYLAGQPHTELVMALDTAEYREMPKRDLILFPHRIAPEKNIAIFKKLAENMPEYDWVVCQETKLTKAEYHTLLAQSKIVFSANLQETLGIGAMEAVLTGSIPLVPDRLSYSEMYLSTFKYPSEWALDIDDMDLHNLTATIQDCMSNFTEYKNDLIRQRIKLIDYLSPMKMVDILKDSIK